MGNAKVTITGIGPQPEVFDLAEEAIIGRSVRATIQIDGDLVSRQHARIYQQGGRWYFEDLGSRNGSLVNGARTTAAELKNGDVIVIGYGKLRFECETDLKESTLAVSFTENDPDLGSAIVSHVADVESDTTNATVALTFQDLVLVNDRIKKIVRIGQKLATILDRNELLEEVMATLFDLFEQADRGAVVLTDKDGTYRVVATRSRNEVAGSTSVMQISRRLLMMVQRERKSVLSSDTGQDDRFSDRASIVGSAGRSIMCAPLVRNDEFFGVIYLSTESLRHPFDQKDLDLLQGIAAPVAICLKNADLVSRIETETQMRTSLSRYLSPDLVSQMSEGQLNADLGGDTKEGTIMFSDIVGFTAMSEKLTATEVVELLNQYFTSMLQAIFGWKGTVDKFGGDAVLAVWGAPVANPEHPLLAAGASLEMQARLFEVNMKLAETGRLDQTGIEPIKMALGLNSGRFVAGNIGGQERIEWTVIGDNVNLAQRVESQGFRGCVLMSPSTREQLGDRVGGFVFDPVPLKGKTEPVSITSIRTLDTPRGIVAALPGKVGLGGKRVHAIIVKVHSGTRRPKVTMRVAGIPSVGDTLEFETNLPECPEGYLLSGRVASVSPLLDAESGRSCDVDVEIIDPQMAALLRADKVFPASRQLADIQR